MTEALDTYPADWLRTAGGEASYVKYLQKGAGVYPIIEVYVSRDVGATYWRLRAYVDHGFPHGRAVGPLLEAVATAREPLFQHSGLLALEAAVNLGWWPPTPAEEAAIALGWWPAPGADSPAEGAP